MPLFKPNRPAACRHWSNSDFYQPTPLNQSLSTADVMPGADEDIFSDPDIYPSSKLVQSSKVIPGRRRPNFTIHSSFSLRGKRSSSKYQIADEQDDEFGSCEAAAIPIIGPTLFRQPQETLSRSTTIKAIDRSFSGEESPASSAAAPQLLSAPSFVAVMGRDRGSSVSTMASTMSASSVESVSRARYNQIVLSEQISGLQDAFDDEGETRFSCDRDSLSNCDFLEPSEATDMSRGAPSVKSTMWGKVKSYSPSLSKKKNQL